VTQLGDHRADDGRATRRIFLRQGPTATAPPPGAEVVASVRGLDDDEEAELAVLTEELRDHLSADGAVLTTDGLVLAGFSDVAVGPGGVVTDTAALLDGGLLAALVEGELLVADPTWEPRYERWSDLALRRDRRTVTVFVAPVEGGDDDE
jgi:hypothetical protein